MRLSLRPYPVLTYPDIGIEYPPYPTSTQTTDSLTGTDLGGTDGNMVLKMLSEATPLSVTEDGNRITSGPVGYHAHKIWISAPVFPGTIDAGNWTVQAGCRYSVTNPSGDFVITAVMRIYAYVWLANNTKGAEIFAPTSDDSAYTTTAALKNVVVAGNSVSLNEGDRICVEIYHDIQSLVGTYTILGLYLKFNGITVGAGLAYVDTPSNITFTYKVAAPTSFAVPNSIVGVDSIVVPDTAIAVTY